MIEKWQDEESNKNDSVPLYLRTSNSNSQLSDDEMDLLVNSFLSADVISDEEDVPLWVDGTAEVDEDFEGKTLQFEEAVLRPIRNENMPGWAPHFPFNTDYVSACVFF